MDTMYTFSSDKFSPVSGELDQDHDDYINPGCFAKQLADFLEANLQDQHYKVQFRCAEDWGQWLEFEHEGNYTLAIGCANMSEIEDGVAEHRVFISPDKPVIRKWLRKIDIRNDLEQLSSALKSVLAADNQITGLKAEKMI